MILESMVVLLSCSIIFVLGERRTILLFCVLERYYYKNTRKRNGK